MAVERKDIEIFFKIEGLEAYITDLETLDSVLQQVNTATKQAKDATDELETSTESFEKLEERLQLMEGGVKALAGSLEFLTGAVGLLGLDDNPFFKELEENTLQVLALARGAIDLSEGIGILARNQKIATAAQAAFNVVAKANPYVLLTSAIIGLAGALVIFKSRANDAATSQRNLNRTFNDLTNFREQQIQFERELADIKGELTPEREIALNKELIDVYDEEISKSRQRIESAKLGEITEGEQELIDRLTANIKLRESQAQQLRNENVLINARTEAKKKEDEVEAAAEKRKEDAQKALERRNAQNALTAELTLNKFTEGREREIEALRRRYEEEIKLAEGNAELLKLIEEDLGRSLKEINDKYKITPIQPLKVENLVPEDAFETTVERLRRLRGEIEATKQLITDTNNDVSFSTVDTAETLATEYAKAFNAVVEEPSKAAGLVKRDVQAALTFASNLNEIFTKGNEKRAERTFKLNKALALSTAIINTAEAITTALTDKTQPSTILRIAQTAVVAAAGAAQIAAISRQQFSPNGNNEAGNAPPPPRGPVYNFQQQSGPIITPGQEGAGLQTEPIRAYVLVSDVNNAQQASQQIENLAKL